jgi:hypothetical protein
MKFILLSLILMSCASTHTLQKGIVTGGGAGAANFIGNVYERPCVAVDSTDSTYEVRCK